jgi:hypothetical protein
LTTRLELAEKRVDRSMMDSRTVFIMASIIAKKLPERRSIVSREDTVADGA